MLFARLNTPLLVVLILLVLGLCAAGGLRVGRALSARDASFHGPIGVVQGTLLGLVGLLLAFGLTMAVGRYENRRSLVVTEANEIGTTYLRAQALAEPARSRSLNLLTDYSDAAAELAHVVPTSSAFDRINTEIDDLQRDLWSAAGDALHADPSGNASKLYVESLNPMFDRHTERVASLRNLVPTPVLLLELIGSAVAIGLLAMHLSLLGRGVGTTIAATLIVGFIIFVSVDLDRPQRGFIRVPGTALDDVRTLTHQPPAITP